MDFKNSALIGYTGFVGSNILLQQPFGFSYNSKNIEEIKNKSFDLIVCAGAPGTKWIANKNPEADVASINKLIENLQTVTCKKFVLISTIDVYSPVLSVNENTKIDLSTLQPYSKHRRMLEEYVENKFNSLIIRLPGIFGTGLKKNVIFDLLNNSQILLNPNSSLQFYWLNHIWEDIQKALDNNLKILNIASEPILLKHIAKEVFNIELPIQNTSPVSEYDMQTLHSNLWGKTLPYLYLKDVVLQDLKEFKQTQTTP